MTQLAENALAARSESWATYAMMDSALDWRLAPNGRQPSFEVLHHVLVAERLTARELFHPASDFAWTYR